ncbi:MAG: glycosyltransferase [Streptosporangiales bacterium]|nr:glycosyltransferase [Streptosporangiales bacterium]
MENVRIAVVTESFLPRVDGVANSVCRVLEHLAARGCEAIVVAPAPGPASYAGFPVHLVRGVALPFYRSFVVGVPSRRVTTILEGFRPDVVHLASPSLLGASGAMAARRLGVPAVAVLQTDVAGFARQYGLRGTDTLIWSWLCRIHRRAVRTLVPSTAMLRELEQRGFPRLALWGRGVDLERFHPRHRCERLRSQLAPGGEIIVGYVGRLAAEKRVHLLAELADLPGIRLVIVGDGPAERRLRQRLPAAVYCGFRTGNDLSRILASFDVFAHTGANETFCQAVQEALASGVPVVAPAAGGPLDLVRPGYNGLLYPPDDPASMRTAVATLAGDPFARGRMSDHARRSVSGRTWASICDELLGHYHDVVAADAGTWAA